jgi:4-hydroxy-L-threonine phosphate dehydrogenase PdxA
LGARTFNMLDLNGVRLRFAQMTEHLSMEEIQKRIDDSR